MVRVLTERALVARRGSVGGPHKVSLVPVPPGDPGSPDLNKYSPQWPITEAVEPVVIFAVKKRSIKKLPARLSFYLAVPRPVSDG